MSAAAWSVQTNEKYFGSRNLRLLSLPASTFNQHPFRSREVSLLEMEMMNFETQVKSQPENFLQTLSTGERLPGVA